MVLYSKRYLVMEVLADPDGKSKKQTYGRIRKQNIATAIQESLSENFGEHGLSLFAKVKVTYFNPITNLCVIRCRRKEYSKIWSSITLVSKIGGIPAFFNLLDLNGNTKCTRKYALKYDKAKFEIFKLTTVNGLPEEVVLQARGYHSQISNMAA